MSVPLHKVDPAPGDFAGPMVAAAAACALEARRALAEAQHAGLPRHALDVLRDCAAACEWTVALVRGELGSPQIPCAATVAACVACEITCRTSGAPWLVACAQACAACVAALQRVCAARRATPGPACACSAKHLDEARAAGPLRVPVQLGRSLSPPQDAVVAAGRPAAPVLAQSRQLKPRSTASCDIPVV